MRDTVQTCEYTTLPTQEPIFVCKLFLVGSEFSQLCTTVSVYIHRMGIGVSHRSLLSPHTKLLCLRHTLMSLLATSYMSVMS